MYFSSSSLLVLVPGLRVQQKSHKLNITAVAQLRQKLSRFKIEHDENAAFHTCTKEKKTKLLVAFSQVMTELYLENWAILHVFLHLQWYLLYKKQDFLGIVSRSDNRAKKRARGRHETVKWITKGLERPYTEVSS